MSLPLNKNLKVDSLKIFVNDTELKNVNWHGANTKNFITHVIGTNKIDDSNLILLKYLFGDNICLMCDSFVSDFKRCQPDLQEL